MQDVLQFLYQASDLLRIGFLCLRQRTLIVLFCPQQIPHQQFHLSAEIGVFLPEQLEFLGVALVILDENSHVVLYLCHFGGLVALGPRPVVPAYPLHCILFDNINSDILHRPDRGSSIMGHTL